MCSADFNRSLHRTPGTEEHDACESDKSLIYSSYRVELYFVYIKPKGLCITALSVLAV